MAILNKQDPQIAKLIKLEDKRQQDDIVLIPSENYASAAVREALGTRLSNKYSEGYSHKRYYSGNQIIDSVEDIAKERAIKLFKCKFANVQAYSGSPANMAIYMALMEPGDTVMGLSLPHGGHLTHGWPVNFSGKFYKSVQYEVDKKTERLDLKKIGKLIRKTKPKMIFTGATAYSRVWEWREFSKIAKSVKACLIADISHIAGLVVAGVHPSPFPYADVVMTTTHKTLRGPRGALILTNNEEIAQKIDKAVFPGLQGGPHDNQTAAIAVALREAQGKPFRTYGAQIVKNAKELAKTLLANNIRLVSGGTDNHLILIDLGASGPTGKDMQNALYEAGLSTNKNTVPNETRSPFVTSGIRIGTPAITTRGMKEPQMRLIGSFIAQIIKDPENESLRKEIKKEVLELTKRFPTP
ncbi:MAG: serine hydroxymethyltransferase [Patescibacteria group bacterium]